MAISLNKMQRQFINRAIITELSVNRDLYGSGMLKQVKALTVKISCDEAKSTTWDDDKHATLQTHPAYDLVREITQDYPELHKGLIE